VRIKVINPNTTESMTRLIEVSARAAVSPGTDLVAVHPTMGPASIESAYDEALSVPGLLTEIVQGEPADGYVIACFGDPGLDAAREVAPGPVVGIAEAAMRTASYLGHSFTIVTTLARTIGRAAELVDRYGVDGYCRNIRACEIPVLELETDPKARERILAECEAAIAADGAEVIVLGCAGMADLCADLTARLGAPVIDGVAAGVTVVEGLVRLNLSTSRTGTYARPPAKSYTGALSAFGLP